MNVQTHLIFELLSEAMKSANEANVGRRSLMRSESESTKVYFLDTFDGNGPIFFRLVTAVMF